MILSHTKMKKLSTLLRGVTLKHHGDFYHLSYIHSFKTENKVKSHKKVHKNKDFCGTVMLSEQDNIVESNQYTKSDKISYIIYDDIESLIKNIDGSANNPEISSATKIGEHISSGYYMPEIWAFDRIENKHTLYCGKDCMKKFCTSLREDVKNINDFEKKKILPLTKEELKLHQNVKVCYICGKIMLEKALYTGKCRGAAHSICNLKFNVPNEIPVVFHWTFSAPVEKEVINIHKDGNESVVAICYKIKFIDSSRWQVYYQILLIVLQKKFLKLTGNDMVPFLNVKVLRKIW